MRRLNKSTTGNTIELWKLDVKLYRVGIKYSEYYFYKQFIDVTREYELHMLQKFCSNRNNFCLNWLRLTT